MAAVMIATTLTLSPLSPVNPEPESSALLRLHDSLLQDIVKRTDIQSRVAASVSCRRLARVIAEHPPSIVDLSSDGVHPEACRRYIEKAKGAIITLTTAKHQQRTACDATSVRRFNTGVRCTQVVPYTRGPSAARLAATLPNLQHLALHEATSCLGGMTDEFAIAVAANCPLLSSLEVAFTRYSLPSEFFTDAGMMALAAGCPRLSCLSLTNCGAITDRSLYAVAVHCRGLKRLALGGYHELISDYGTVVLFQACSELVRVVLSGKLRRVTDESVEALATNSGPVLQEIKLTRSMGDRSLAALAAHCKALRVVDCCKCEAGALTPKGVAAMLKSLSEKHLQQQSAQTAIALEAAIATAESIEPPGVPDHATALSGVLRVLLPRGVAAADVVRLGPSGAGGHDAAGGMAAASAAAAAAWRAVIRDAVRASAPGAVEAATAFAASTPAAAALATAAQMKSGVMTSGGVGVGGASNNGTRGAGGTAAAAVAPFEEVHVRL
ncbi:hypothetical protein Vretimale_17423 [Volvox reticuliferus]|uniref:F-box/LRR-repeat protein 15-like leucin rich repeat domain-containing protein n=1 Tax=Volvox reticuliferus TaxID=1737510 RepID=A0A8J4GSZ3_9CHLO|nr:hypothetical protein Vretifemale_9403 [Volvox reticuliferus]GIM14471.1 hypothetical protein Vretimale_17423 [Volvox reticuliferus]